MTKHLLIVILAAAAAGMSPASGSAMLAPPGPEGAAYDRAADAKVIRTALESRLVRERLAAFGLTEKEIDSRLERLSDKEVHQLAKDMGTLGAGGHDFLEGTDTVRVSRVLVIVLIVLLVLLIV